MNRMRKGLAALAAAVFFLGVGGVAQAVIGIPDDVPGSTLLFPFFKVDPNRTATAAQDTLLVVTNTGDSDIIVHVTVWTRRSDHVYDFNIPLTPNDVWPCSLYDLIIGRVVRGCEHIQRVAPTQVKDQLLVQNVDGKPLLVGYITVDVVKSNTFIFPGARSYPFAHDNVLMGHMYLVNLVNGSSTGFNATSIETENPCSGQPAKAVPAAALENSLGFYRSRCVGAQSGPECVPPFRPTGFDWCETVYTYGDFTERIDGPNGDWAQTGDAGGHGGTPPVLPHSDDSPLNLLVRYFSIKPVLNAHTEVWLWKDYNTGTIESPLGLDIAVYDEEENIHSIRLLVPHEVNFVMTDDIIQQGDPGGWFRIDNTCGSFGSCEYNYATGIGGNSPVQSVAYAAQFASNDAEDPTLRWDAVFPAHRQYTDYRVVP